MIHKISIVLGQMYSAVIILVNLNNCIQFLFMLIQICLNSIFCLKELCIPSLRFLKYLNKYVRYMVLLEINKYQLFKDESFLNLARLIQIWILITLLRLVLQQTEFSLVPNQSEKCNYNLNFV